jgi:fatty acid amide hydrolase
MFMKAVCVPELWVGDKNVPPVLFDELAYSRKGKLKIGFFVTDHWFEPSAASKRAVNKTICALQLAGHECVPFSTPTNGWENYGL